MWLRFAMRLRFAYRIACINHETMKLALQPRPQGLLYHEHRLPVAQPPLNRPSIDPSISLPESALP